MAKFKALEVVKSIHNDTVVLVLDGIPNGYKSFCGVKLHGSSGFTSGKYSEVWSESSFTSLSNPPKEDQPEPVAEQFEVGDEVESIEYPFNGRGFVVPLEDDKFGGLYPVAVRLNGWTEVIQYTKDGRGTIGGDVSLRKLPKTLTNIGAEPIVIQKGEPFKVGDPVKDDTIGMGVVCEVYDNPVIVDFEKGRRSYTIDGRYAKSAPITLSKVERWIPKVGEVYLFRDHNNYTWIADLLEEIVSNGYGVASGTYLMCRPFSLDLVGKTENPEY